MPVGIIEKTHPFIQKMTLFERMSRNCVFPTVFSSFRVHKDSSNASLLTFKFEKWKQSIQNFNAAPVSCCPEIHSALRCPDLIKYTYISAKQSLKALDGRLINHANGYAQIIARAYSSWRLRFISSQADSPFSIKETSHISKQCATGYGWGCIYPFDSKGRKLSTVSHFIIVFCTESASKTDVLAM